MARLTGMGMRIAWRVLRPSRMITVPARAAAPMPAPAAGSLDPQLVEAWKTDLDDLADLAASFADPSDAETAERRRAAFSADAVARRLSAALQSQQGD